MLAYAKINLTLEVLQRRDDGYHGLRSVMLPVALADELTFAPARAFTFVCEPEVPGENIVIRALRRICGKLPPAAVTLRKHIPAGAGLGGGSSDAAAVLRAAMNGAFGALGERDWIGDARALGSDVPFFLVDGGALVEGTGERVTALGAAPPWWIALLVPDVYVATPDAYARLAAARAVTPAPSRPRSESVSLRVLTAVQRGDFAGALAAASNDFEPTVCAAYPAVSAALAALRDAGAAHAMLSGSGGTCFALCADETSARALCARVVRPPGAQLHVVSLAPSHAWRPAAPA
ncbi:MAG: 4-(cytidine 5'-diphospho)-2-C-methyl-D-erythritol kinase [Candidatus Velthaea sp.]